MSGRRRGITVLEFAVAAPVLVLGLGGVFSLSAGLLKMVQVGQVCRAAAGMAAAGMDLSDPANQRLLARAAAGLELNPAGSAAVFITKLRRADSGEYEVEWSTAFGNAARWRSALEGNAGRIREWIDLRPGECVVLVETFASHYPALPGMIPPVIRVRTLT
jgi:hypothetical protein